MVLIKYLKELIILANHILASSNYLQESDLNTLKNRVVVIKNAMVKCERKINSAICPSITLQHKGALALNTGTGYKFMKGQFIQCWGAAIPPHIYIYQTGIADTLTGMLEILALAMNEQADT